MNKISIERTIYRTFAYFLHRFHSPICIPTGLGLCLTSECNLKCVYCMRESFKPPKGRLTLKQVQYLIKKMPYISNITVQGLCEPFLNPETPQILNWLKSQGMFISFTTNGAVPLTPERLECLKSVDDFVMSFDTYNPETFAELRKGTTLKAVRDNFERLVEWKKKNGRTVNDNPPIHINAVISAKNIKQMKGFIDMMNEYKDQIAYIMVDPVSRPEYSKMDPLALEKNKEFDLWLEDFRQHLEKHSDIPVVGLDYMFKQSTNWKSCPLVDFDIWIEPNGDVYNFYDFKNVYGNVFKQNPLLIFNCKYQREFRKKLRTNNPPLQQCHVCNFAREGWQTHGGYIERARRLSTNKRMTFYEATKTVLKKLTHRGKSTF